MFTNKTNNKKYIGQTWNLERRIREHTKGKGYAKLLKDAISKYGIDNFDIVTLQKADKQEELDRLEIALIEILNTLQPNGYNLAKGGAGGKHSDETKTLIGSYHKNKVVSAETRQKLSNASQGRNLSNEVKEKISEKVHAIHETKEKPVFFFNCLTHELVAQYKNMHEVQQKLSIPLTRIYGSISVTSSFKFGDFHCYARYVNEPLAKEFTFGRKIVVTTTDGKEMIFQSQVEAEKMLNLGRNVIGSLLRGKSKKSKYFENGQHIAFIARYLEDI